MSGAPPLRVLMVEDSPPDATLVLRALRAIGRPIEHERVEDAGSLAKLLESRPWDLVISDWSLPQFSALKALEVVKRAEVDIPFIIVSGTIGEESAVEAMRAGAHDYVSKNRLARLAPAVERELRDCAMRAAHRDAVRTSEESIRDSRQKSEFLAVMSHELRTPLNAIIGFSELVLSDRDPALAPIHAKRIRDVLGAGHQLLTLINDVLDLSKVEAGHIDLKLVALDARAAVAEVIVVLSALAQQKRIEIAIPQGSPAIPVLADQRRLQQVLLNLGSNAIKFTSEGGRVVIAAESIGDRVRFLVSDTGLGIALEDAHRLFVPFSQLDAGRKRRFGGTGLGLSISKRLVEAMGGAIGFESTVGKGSDFFFSLPAAARIAPRVPSGSLLPPETPRSSAPSPIRALIVDDNDLNRRLLEALLQRLGRFTVDVVESGSAALVAASAAVPAVVLMDIEMPEMDGVRTMQRMQENESLRHVPMIAVTAHAMAGDAEKFLAAGFAAYVSKPIGRTALAEALDRALGADAWVRTETKDSP